MKKLRRWPRLALAFVYTFGIIIVIVFIANEFVIKDASSFSINKGGNIVFGISIVEENPSTLLSELQVGGRTPDWSTSFLLQSQSPSIQVFLDYVSVFYDDNLGVQPELCIDSVHLLQNEKVPLKVIGEINYDNSFGKLISSDKNFLNQYIFDFEKDLCLPKEGKYFLPHLFLGLIASETYADLGITTITGRRALEFFPFEEQNILININSKRLLSDDGELFFRPSLEVTVSQQGWKGRFYTDENGNTNLHLSRHSFYRYILLVFAFIVAVLVLFLDNIVDEVASYFEISFGLLLGLWGAHEIFTPNYIDSSIAIDVIIYSLYVLVIGEMAIVFFDELIADWMKHKVRIIHIAKNDIDNECVTIHNNSVIPIDMTNWVLSDEVGHRYKFPIHILRGRGSVMVWTSEKKFPKNAADHLCWGRKHSVWNDNHDTAYLEDSKGIKIDQYSYSGDDTNS